MAGGNSFADFSPKEEERCLQKVKSWLKPRLSDFLEELPQPHNAVTCRDRDGFPLPKCQAGTYRHPSAREQCLQLYQLAEQGAEKKPQKKIKHQRAVFIGHLKIAAW